MSFKIFTDTSANLPTSLVEKDAIGVIPFPYYVKGEEMRCTDTASFDGKAFYDMMRDGEKVTTSQITPQHYIDAFTPILEEGEDVLFVSMSSGISGSYNSSEVACETLRKQFPERKVITVDTLGASLGEGIPALWADACRKKGMDIEETAEYLRRRCKKVCQIFVVDDLIYLKRTGRLSGAAMVVGKVLGIKPLLTGNEKGQIVNFGKCRGKRNALIALAEKYDELVFEPEKQIVGIAHADCEEDAKFLATLIRRNKPPKKLVSVMYEPVTGSHVGPGTVALFFEGDEDVRLKFGK